MATENTHFGAYEIDKMLQGVDSIYFIGIGGINMSSLAHITHLRGIRTAGSDRCRTALTQKLEDAGIKINYSHSAKNINSFGAVVYTVAISPDNPEYLEAKRRGIPCISRADYLGYVMVGYRNRIGVSGMHGKSTCTSMCATTFMVAGADPTVLSGAELALMGGAYRVGGEENFIFEACEYMDSFLDFNPSIAVILNIEMDHVDYFHSIEQVRSSFARFAAITGKDGYTIANGDDENVKSALSDYCGNLLTFGIENKSSDVRAENIEKKNGLYSFDIVLHGDLLCRVSLSVSGYHNVYNALAAIAAAHESGIPTEDIVEGLANFKGAKRRMEFKGEISGAQVFDDYGHHPTEVGATLSGAKNASSGRLICAFQPHTFSRTAALCDQFKCAFSEADVVILADIYAAREENIYGISSEKLAMMIGDKAIYGGTLQGVADLIKKNAREGDMVVVMGAGDIFKVYKLLELE